MDTSARSHYVELNDEQAPRFLANVAARGEARVATELRDMGLY